LAGSGTDIWGIADEFHFVYQRLSGDGELTARVVRVRRSDEWAQAGVMIRESLEPGSRYAHMFASADFGPVFDWRPAVDGKCIGGSSNILWNVPYWVKVARQGTNFAGYYSKNGTDWKLFRRESMPMAEDTYVGLSVTAHNNGAINQAVFDHVELSVSPATAGRKN
jgi:regulation of enolase protein 1 (concanavalin A-like superfamily)